MPAPPSCPQALPIPELMPFRLTRQLLGVLQPHEGTELLVAPMAAALGALSAQRQLLGSILAIFLREPLAVGAAGCI